jgi:hypothetical protein
MRAVLVEGMTVADAIRGAGRAGDLGLPAFDIGRYAYQLVKASGRERYEADNDSALHHSIDGELKALEIAALKHARATRARLKGDGSDSPDAIAKAAKAWPRPAKRGETPQEPPRHPPAPFKRQARTQQPSQRAKTAHEPPRPRGQSSQAKPRAKRLA